MAKHPRRTLSPERMAAVYIYSVAKKAGATHVAPQGDERARIIADLQKTATPYPHLLAKYAGIFLGAARNATIDAPADLIAAQLLIDAGADLTDVERWTEIGFERTRYVPPSGVNDGQASL